MKFLNTGNKAEIHQVSKKKVQTKEDSYWLRTSKQQEDKEKKLCLQNSEKKNTSNLEFYTHPNYVNQM